MASTYTPEGTMDRRHLLTKHYYGIALDLGEGPSYVLDVDVDRPTQVRWSCVPTAIGSKAVALRVMREAGLRGATIVPIGD